MKWPTIASLGLAFVSNVFAAGTVQPQSPSCTDGSPTLYKFLVEANNPDLNNRYLSTGSGEKSIGLYSEANKAPDWVGYKLPGAGKKLVEFHSWPIGFVDHSLAMQRVNGSPLWFMMDDIPGSASHPIESIDKHWQVKGGYLTYKYPYAFSNPNDKVWYLYKYEQDDSTYTIRWRSDNTYGPGYHPIKIKVEEYCHGV